MIAVLRRGRFGLLLGGQLVSNIGDLVMFVALPFWVYQMTGSVTATGGMFLAIAAPQVVLSPIAGVFVDRWDRRRTMIACDLIRAATVTGLLLVRSADDVWLVYLVGFAESSVSRFFMPARVAAVPLVVGPHDLPRANALFGVSEALAQLVGPALGGLLVAVKGPHGAIAFDAATYLISALAITLLVVPRPNGREQRPVGGGLAAVVADLREGVQVVSSRPSLRALFASEMAMMFAQGIINVLLVVTVRRIWGGGPRELGWLISAQGVGALIGGALLSGPARRVPARSLIVAGGAGSGVLVAVVVRQPSIAVAVALVGLIGVLIVGMMIAEQTLLQLNSDDANRGRVSALIMTAASAAMLVSTAGTSVIGDAAGPVSLMTVAGGAMALSGLCALAIPRPEAKHSAGPELVAEERLAG